MSAPADPYRVLGLAPGASLNEIRSAYRRLVKQVHPDRAGERMLPRFLAVQAAYEQLVDGEGRLRARPGASGATSAAPRPPARPRPTPGAGASASPGSPPGARPRPRRGTPPPPGSQPPPGSTPPPGARSSAPPHRPRRATPGSTSYDEAAGAPADGTWSGGSWYGEATGTYWTVNPREYADPRKHGPAYQARARRPQAAPGRGAPGGDAPGGDAPGHASGHDGPREDAPDPAPRPRPSTAAARPPAAATPPVIDLEALVRRADPVRLRDAALRGPRHRRLALAILGWPPIGWALAWLIGTATGCATYSATCAPGQELLALVVQPVVIGALAVAPEAAAMAGVATLCAIGMAVPAALVLSAGTLPQPSEGRAALVVLTALGYAGGAVMALRRLLRHPAT